MKRSWTSDQKRQVAARGSWRCAVCDNLLNCAFEVDHIVALEQGGEDDIDTNAQALCSNCHGKKTQNERVLRIKKARERLKELQKNDPLEPKTITRRPEEVILDSENPFARFAFLPDTLKL
jgi:5-methylcytosine-specific restriction endonuclease McrA